MVEAVGVAAVLALAAAGGPQTETVSAGRVTAELGYTRTSPDAFSDLRVTIKRDGSVVYTASLYDKECKDLGGGLSSCRPADDAS